MPIVPRQGRKGGKVVLSPAITINVDTAVSPAALLPPVSGAAATSSTPASLDNGVAGSSNLSVHGSGGGENNNNNTATTAHVGSSAVPGSAATATTRLLEHSADGKFDLDALLDSRRQAAAAAAAAVQASAGATAANGSNETSAVGSGAHAGNPSAGTTAGLGITAPHHTTPSVMDGYALKLNMDAISQIGHGVVIGGNKNAAQLVTAHPRADADAVRAKLAHVLTRQATAASTGTRAPVQMPPPNGRMGRAVSAGMEALASGDAVITRHPLTALALAVRLSVEAADADVLVLVPRSTEVSPMADYLRQLRATSAAGPTTGTTTPAEWGGDGGVDVKVCVGELSGGSHAGSAGCTLWVTSAETAFCLYGRPTLPPFTHVVFAGRTPATPLLTCLQLALRERLRRWNSNPAHPPARVRWVVCAHDGDVESAVTFFQSMRVRVLPDSTTAAASQSHGADADVYTADVATSEINGEHEHNEKEAEQQESNVVEFSLDETHALAAMDILHAAHEPTTMASSSSLSLTAAHGHAVPHASNHVGTRSMYHHRDRPHQKCVLHRIAVAARVVRVILDAATVAVRVYVITPDVHDTLAQLRMAGVHQARLFAESMEVWSMRTPVVTAQHRAAGEESGGLPPSSTAPSSSASSVYVMSRLTYAMQCGSDAGDVVHHVIDLGCVRRLSVADKHDGYLSVMLTKWASLAEQSQRREVLGHFVPGAYYLLGGVLSSHPMQTTATRHEGGSRAAGNEEETVVGTDYDGTRAAPHEHARAAMEEVERALLHCVRAGVPLAYARAALSATGEEEVLRAAVGRLQEKLYVTMSACAAPPHAGSISAASAASSANAATSSGSSSALVPLPRSMASAEHGAVTAAAPPPPPPITHPHPAHPHRRGAHAADACEDVMNGAAALNMTLCGEIAARLPWQTELGQLVIQGAALGMAEAAVVVAAVAATAMRVAPGSAAATQASAAHALWDGVSRGPDESASASSAVGGVAEAELTAWREAVRASRVRCGGAVTAAQSDVLADALIFLHWCALRVGASETSPSTQTGAGTVCQRECESARCADFVREAGLSESQLQCIAAQVRQAALQLMDYTYLDCAESSSAVCFIDDAAAIGRTVARVREHVSILTFLLTAALASNIALVRDGGATSSGSVGRVRGGAVGGGEMSAAESHGGGEGGGGGGSHAVSSSSWEAEGGDKESASPAAAALLFVRTSKKVIAAAEDNPCTSAWTREAAVVPVQLRNTTAPLITGAGWSVIHTTYMYAALLMLHPTLEYSAAQEMGGRRGRVVYLGVTCRHHMKRVRLGVDEAARLLDFRAGMLRALGVLAAVRATAPTRTMSRRRFVLEMKKSDPYFDPDAMQSEARRLLVDLVTDTEFVEHQGTFETMNVHSYLMEPVEEPVASDVAMAQAFCDGSLWATTMGGGEEEGAMTASGGRRRGERDEWRLCTGGGDECGRFVWAPCAGGGGGDQDDDHPGHDARDHVGPLSVAGLCRG